MYGLHHHWLKLLSLTSAPFVDTTQRHFVCIYTTKLTLFSLIVCVYVCVHFEITGETTKAFLCKAIVCESGESIRECDIKRLNLELYGEFCSSIVFSEMLHTTWLVIGSMLSVKALSGMG